MCPGLLKKGCRISQKGSTSDNSGHIFVIISIIVVLVIILILLIFSRRRHAIKETTQIISETPSENPTITQPSIAAPKPVPEVQVQVSSISMPSASPETQRVEPTVVSTEN